MKVGCADARSGARGKFLEQVIERAQADLQGRRPHLGLLFATNHYEDELGEMAAEVRAATGLDALLGCTGEGVIGPAREHERQPAVVLWLAHAPGVPLDPFHLSQEDIEAADSENDWRRLLRIGKEDAPEGILLLGDPFSVETDALLGGIGTALPVCPVFGGMASGAEKPGQSVLVRNEEIHRQGAIGIAFRGPIRIATIVSQGCRPVGRPLVITRAERNLIYELGGKPALRMLQEIFETAPTTDQRLMEEGILLGRVINERQEQFRRGDFLIRNLMGADHSSGALAVADLVRVGITVQFHVRDASTADEDLRALLSPHAQTGPAGSLIFSCNGRGTRLFPDPDHESGLLRQIVGPAPLAGFFCAGELGMIGGKNFIHGHTASIALFREPS